MNEITCPKCGFAMSIDAALEGQIESRISAENEKRHREEMLAAKKDAAESAARALELEKQRALQDLEFERRKIALELEGQAKLKAMEQETATEQLKKDAEAEKANNAKLREELTRLLEKLRLSEETKENLQLESQKKLNEESIKIRDEARKQAEESAQLKLAEMEKTLRDTQASLEAAQRKAAQGSQQNQGEVLEISLEEGLRGEFLFDDISEVKKGQRGADVVQIVKDRLQNECGILLWETKNAAWQPAWIPKFKSDIREAGASAGILVSKEIPDKYGDIAEIDGVWVVKPSFALPVAGLMRAQIIGVHAANRNAENKDEKMEYLFQYLTGPEFKNRMEAILDNYTALQSELEKERRSAERRWAKQEKSIRAVISNTAGMYGDLQGLIGGELGDIKLLEEDDGPEDE
ncbi:MAG: DUF2130 domain-containing protein [Candidatus Methanoplasma sp.]|jgi:hypothetical protein|nr:DUF2130 domain-containing protein [Candidatus Methanoplasma sp.]